MSRRLRDRFDLEPSQQDLGVFLTLRTEELGGERSQLAMPECRVSGVSSRMGSRMRARTHTLIG
jgi:hypothetical protein